MKPPSKTSAQKRADQIAAFQRELTQLEQDEVVALEPAQRQAIADHHRRLLDQYRSLFDIDHSQQEKQLSLGMRVASFIGALALGASVFFLFYQFWGLLPTAGQLAILITASLFSLVATIAIAAKDASGYFTKLAGLVAFICFVLNISMLGQIFNITPTDNALIPWALFALLLAYAFDMRLLLIAGIVCISAFVAARVGTWSGMYWIHFGQRPENFFPVALLLFGLPSLIDHHRFSGFASTYRVFGMLVLFLPMLILSNWGLISYLNIDSDLIEGGYQLAGFGLSAGAVWLGIRRGWGEVVNTGITFFVIFLYTKFFDWWWEVMPKYLFFFVLGLIAILILLVLRRLRHGQQPQMEEAGQ
jgi:uncharacterized membrane protein